MHWGNLLFAGTLALAASQPALSSAKGVANIDSPAKEIAAQKEAFGACLQRLQASAEEQGLTSETVRESLAQIKFVERVIELDRRQPEFTTTFADYLNRRVTDQRVRDGRRLLNEHKDLLQRVEREYGVPAPYLVAFWGLETNFGSYFGKMRVLDSLATLACDERRSTYFTRELMAALGIIDEGAIAAENMEGSWAGAMGHVQFMPSVFKRYALDYDDDGRRDLWNSLPDAMGSAANFLDNLGWDGDYRWGREVVLPEEFPYLEAGLKNRRPLSEWQKIGVRTTNGGNLPQADLEASLLVPAGHNGPAFLVYDNFKVIMGWNQSEYYAIAVGHLADRIAGAGELHQSPPEDAPRLSRDQVMEVQQKLTDAGHDVGKVDGIWGPATRRGLGTYQDERDMVADGFPSREVLTQLGVEL